MAPTALFFATPAPTPTLPNLFLLLKPLSCINFHLIFPSGVSMPQKPRLNFLLFRWKESHEMGMHISHSCPALYQDFSHVVMSRFVNFYFNTRTLLL